MTPSDEPLRKSVAAMRALMVGDALGCSGAGSRENGDGAARGDTFSTSEVVVGDVTESALAMERRLIDGASGAIEWDALSWAIPLGIVTAAGAYDEMARVAHSLGATRPSLPAGVAVAAGVSAGVGGFLVRDMIGQAVEAAELLGDSELARLIEAACGAAQASGGGMVGDAVAVVVPDDASPSSLAAFALGVAFGAQNVRRGAMAAADSGESSAAAAALSAALCAVVAPASLPESWANAVEEATGIDGAGLAARLYQRRPSPTMEQPQPAKRRGFWNRRR